MLNVFLYCSLRNNLKCMSCVPEPVQHAVWDYMYICISRLGFIAVCVHQVAVEEASMTQMDHSTFTPQQLSVEKLIKEQNFTWKVRHRWLCGEIYQPCSSCG